MFCRYIACELFEGNLKQFVAREKPFNALTELDEIAWLKIRVEVALQVANALKFVHKKGFVHKDIKPHNFVIRRGKMENGEPNWVCKLTDFGLSKLVIEGRSACDETGRFGTMGWIAPEITRAYLKGHFTQLFSKRSDVWSLGCVLHFIFHGKRPVDYLGNAVKFGDEVSQFDYLINKMIQEDANQRPDMETVKKTLEQCGS